MFDTLCTFPLTSDLFAQAVHPSEPLVAVGLSSGHVETLQLPQFDDPSTTDAKGRRGSNGTGVVTSAWRTKRHKGSCRCLTYSIDGSQIYSAGTDGIVKSADSATGVVVGKVAVPFDPSISNSASSSNGSKAPSSVDAATVIHALTPQTLLLGTDSGALHLYDLRDPAPSVPLSSSSKTAFSSTRPSQTYHPHTDYISSLTSIPPSATSTSGFSKQFLTTGSTTLALTDVRRGVLAKSEDQEDLLLSSLYITDLPQRKSAPGASGDKAIVGTGEGVITLWEKGHWDDQDERIMVSREKETLDCMAHVPDGVGGLGRKVAVGLGDGSVRFVRFGMNKVVGEVMHDDIEGVSELGFDVGGRMISGGGMVLKVWAEHIEGAEEDEEEDAEDGDDDSDNDVENASSAKRGAQDESDEDEDEDSGDESSDDEKARKRRKKRKRGKGPTSTTKAAFNFAGLD